MQLSSFRAFCQTIQFPGVTRVSVKSIWAHHIDISMRHSTLSYSSMHKTGLPNAFEKQPSFVEAIPRTVNFNNSKLWIILWNYNENHAKFKLFCHWGRSNFQTSLDELSIIAGIMKTRHFLIFTSKTNDVYTCRPKCQSLNTQSQNEI